MMVQVYIIPSAKQVSLLSFIGYCYGQPIENRFIILIIVTEVIMTMNAISQHILKVSTASLILLFATVALVQMHLRQPSV